jgi:hypothetical protein
MACALAARFASSVSGDVMFKPGGAPVHTISDQHGRSRRDAEVYPDRAQERLPVDYICIDRQDSSPYAWRLVMAASAASMTNV